MLSGIEGLGKKSVINLKLKFSEWMLAVFSNLHVCAGFPLTIVLCVAYRMSHFLECHTN